MQPVKLAIQSRLTRLVPAAGTGYDAAYYDHYAAGGMDWPGSVQVNG